MTTNSTQGAGTRAQAQRPGKDRVNWAHLVAQCDQSSEAMGPSYWAEHSARPHILEPLGRPCHDCAVVHGFYTELSIDLARQSGDVIERVCSSWFCHNKPGRACRGNIDLIAFIRARDSDASLAEDAKRLSPEGVAARAEGIAQVSERSS